MRAVLTARALVAATVGVGSALVAVAALSASSLPAGTLALFAAAAFLTELFVVPRDERSFDPRDLTSFTFSASVHIAALLVLGIWAAVLVAAFGVVAADGLGRYPLRKVAFNAASSAVAAATGGAVFQLAGGDVGSLSLPADFPAVALAAVTLYGVGAVLVSTIVALDAETRLLPTLREGVLSGVAASIGEAGVGLALALFILIEPWGAAALLPLVFAVYRSHERLVTLRRETAHALETFANVVDERDPYTYRHSARVADYVEALAEALDLPARTVAKLRWAGRLHDLGKISVDAAVLRKPGKLDPAEWAAMKLHPRLSARLLRRFRLATDQAKAVEYHHERVDGTGYYGIRGTELPLAAHFLVIADSYDAMTSDRPYRERLPRDVALAEIEANVGSQFHTTLAKAFVALERGVDPLTVLSDDERAEIHRLVQPRRAAGVAGSLTVTPSWIAAAGLLGALGAVGVGRPLLALPAIAILLVGVALSRFRAARARRLGATLRSRLAAAGSRDAAFAGLVSELARESDVRWAGLLAWRERECAGTVELAWPAEGARPSETALQSWLIREAETASGTLIAAGAELGTDGSYIAIPLRQQGSLAGYVVVALAGRVSAAVRSALAESSDAMVEAFAVGTPAPLRLRAVTG